MTHSERTLYLYCIAIQGVMNRLLPYACEHMPADVLVEVSDAMLAAAEILGVEHETRH